MAGISTNFGVESTARQAQDMGYELVFVEDAMTTTLKTEEHRFATETIFPRMGRVRSTAAVLFRATCKQSPAVSFRATCKQSLAVLFRATCKQSPAARHSLHGLIWPSRFFLGVR